MKRILLFISVIVVCGLIYQAKAQDIYLGITGGMNIADMKIMGDGEEQTLNTRNLYGFGGILGLQLNNNFSLQLRPLYLQKGATLDQDQPSPDIDFLMTFLEMNVSLKAVTGNQLRPYVLVGPSLGYLITAEVEADFPGSVLTADIKDISQNMEFGLGIGAGIEYSLGKGYLFLEGRYTFGMNNLNKGGTVEFTVDGTVVASEEVDEEDEYKNRGFQIMAGYALPLSK